MQKKLLALVASALLVVLAGTALAATRTVKLGGTLHAAISDTTGKITITGAARDRGLGQIAAVFNDAKIGKGKTSPVTLYAAGGSLSGTAKFDSAVVSSGDGDITIKNGVLPLGKGTADFKGATGRITFSGIHSKASNTFTIKYSGSLKIRK